MTSPRRVLALTAVTVGLAAAVGVTGDRAALPARPLLVPGLAFDDVVRLELTVRDRPPLSLELAAPPIAGGATRPQPDETAVRDLISALAAARFDRTAGGASRPRTGVDDVPRAIVRLARRHGEDVEVRVGLELPASGQAWVAAGQRLGLVPAWVADALVRDPDTLRRRHPFPAAADIDRVSITDVDLRLDLVDAARDAGGGIVLVDPARRDHLRSLLAAVTLSFPDEPLDLPSVGPVHLAAWSDGAGGASGDLSVAGMCPGHTGELAVASSVGNGCVPERAIDAVLVAARDLTTPEAIAAAPIEAFDGRTIDRLDLDGTPVSALVPEGAGWKLVLGDRSFAIDAALARDVAEALTAPAIREPVASTPAPRSAEQWVVHPRLGAAVSWTVERTPSRVSIRRDDEPVRLVLDARAAAAVRLIGPALRDRTLLAIDPTSITAIDARGLAPASLARGALIDEWNARPLAGAGGATADPAAVTALRERLALLRATAWLDARALGAVRRTLTLTVDTGPGQPPATHAIDVGAARPGGCAARIDGTDVAALAAADCAALLAPLATRGR